VACSATDIVSVRAAAKALVAFVDGMPAPTASNVINLAERRATYGSRLLSRYG